MGEGEGGGEGSEHEAWPFTPIPTFPHQGGRGRVCAYLQCPLDRGREPVRDEGIEDQNRGRVSQTSTLSVPFLTARADR